MTAGNRGWTRAGSLPDRRRDDGTGHRLRADPVLPATHHAITDGCGDRVGVVRPTAGRFTHSGDGFASLHHSPQAALRDFLERGGESAPEDE